MPVVRLRSWEVKSGMEKQARQELDKIYSIRREARGYLFTIEMVAPHNPHHISILAVWKDSGSADAFAVQDHTMSHLAAMRRWASESSLVGDVYDAKIDLPNLPK